jgi:hypothetical protein
MPSPSLGEAVLGSGEVADDIVSSCVCVCVCVFGVCRVSGVVRSQTG